MTDTNADLFAPEIGTVMPVPSTGTWSVERLNEKATGFKGISISDENGLFVANMIGQLDDSELDKARLIVKAVNEYRRNHGI